MPSKCKCCVPECNTIKYKATCKVTFHAIPANKVLAQKWRDVIKNPRLKVLKDARICGRHFERHQYKDLRRNILKKGVIPVLFLPKSTVNVVSVIETTDSAINSDVEKCNIVQNTSDKQFLNNSLENTTSSKSNKIDNSPASSSNPIKSYDFTKTCRICLLEKQDLENMESDFIQNLFQSSDIFKFSDHDTYPKQICAVCLEELKVVHSFSIKCGKSSDVFRKYNLDIANSEQITDKMHRFSQTVKVSYVPSAAEMRDSENKDRTYKYELFGVDGIHKPDLSSLFSISRYKESFSETGASPILSSSVQTYEYQSSEMTKLRNVSSTNLVNENDDILSTIPSISTENKSTSDANIVPENSGIVENKCVKEYTTNCTQNSAEVASNKRVLRKRKVNENITVQSKESPGLPIKKQSTKLERVLLGEKYKSPSQDAIIPVPDQDEPNSNALTEEKLVNHSRSAKRRSRILSRTAESKRKPSKSSTLNRPLRKSTRKQVASGNATVYWYDKIATDSSENQTSTALVNENGSSQQVDTVSGYELLGFDRNGKSIVNEINGNRSEIRISIDTVAGNTVAVEKTAGSVERTAGLAEITTVSAERTDGLAEITTVSVEKTTDAAEKTTGATERTDGLDKITTVSAERTASLAEITTISAERTASLADITTVSAERTASLAEITTVSDEITTGAAERTTSLAETTAGAAGTTISAAEATTSAAERTAVSVGMNVPSIMNEAPVKQNENIILKSQPTEINNTDEEKTKSVVNIQRRGRPKKRRIFPNVKLQTALLYSSETRISNTASHTNIGSSVHCSNGHDHTGQVVTENATCNNDNDNTVKIIVENGNRITENVKCNIEQNNIVKIITENATGNIENDNTLKITTQNEKCSITAKCNMKNGNNVKRTTKNIKATKRNTKTSNAVKDITEKTGNAVTNAAENNNSTLTISENKQTSLILPEPDNINANTTQHVLPTKEKVKSSSQRKDCQHRSDKITKENKTTVNIVENEGMYMKLRHTNVKFNANLRKKRVKSLIGNLNIKHLKISRKEVSKLVSVKLQLNQSSRLSDNSTKINVTKTGSKINVPKTGSKKKVRSFSNPTSNRILRSSQRNNENSASINVENIKLTNDSILQNVPKLNLNVVDKDKNSKTDMNNVSEPKKITLNVVQKEEINSSHENIKLKQDACSVNTDTCSVNKIEEVMKNETALKNNNTDQESSKNKLHDTCAQKNAKSSVEYETCEPNINTERGNKCSPDTTTKYDTCSANSTADHSACLPNNEMENECSLKSTAECGKCSVDSIAEVDTCSQYTHTEHAYCSVDNETEHESRSLNKKTEHESRSLDFKTECLPNTNTEHNEHDVPLANNVTELETYPLDSEQTPLIKAPDNYNTDIESKSQLMELLTEFVVFSDQNCISSTAGENPIRPEFNTDVPTEIYSPRNYYQLLDGTNQEDSQFINSDAMLSNAVNVSPELKAGIPTVYVDELNDSFENTINNILNTEYNTICDGQLVGAGIVLEDIAANEEVLPTEEIEIEAVPYQHVNEKSPRFKINCDNVYFNKRSGMIVTSLPAEETGNYSSEDEYYSSRFQNSWVPVQPECPAFDNVETPVPSTSAHVSGNIVIKHSGVVIPTQQNKTSTSIVTEQNFQYQCSVCRVAFQTKEQLNYHIINAEHVTKRFCKCCKQSLDIAEYDEHMSRHENEEMFCCEHCGEMIYGLDKFLRHSRTHRRYNCLLCPMQFDTKYLLNQHVKVHTGNKQDQCKHCNRKFARTSSLISHLAARTCQDKDKFACTVCRKIFDSKKKSMQHVTIHQRYECAICNKTYSTEKYCKNHLKSVHGITQNA